MIGALARLKYFYFWLIHDFVHLCKCDIEFLDRIVDRQEIIESILESIQCTNVSFHLFQWSWPHRKNARLSLRCGTKNMSSSAGASRVEDIPTSLDPCLYLCLGTQEEVVACGNVIEYLVKMTYTRLSWAFHMATFVCSSFHTQAKPYTLDWRTQTTEFRPTFTWNFWYIFPLKFV